jgi:hypothetical protein
MAHRTHAAEPMRREAVRSGDILRRFLATVLAGLAAVQLWIEDCRLLTQLDQGSCPEKGEPAVFEF